MTFSYQVPAGSIESGVKSCASRKLGLFAGERYIRAVEILTAVAIIALLFKVWEFYLHYPATKKRASSPWSLLKKGIESVRHAESLLRGVLSSMGLFKKDPRLKHASLQGVPFKKIRLVNVLFTLGYKKSLLFNLPFKPRLGPLLGAF